MIVPMKKTFIIVQEKDAQDSVATLRKLGLLHIEHQQLPQGKEMSRLQEDLEILNAAISVLSEEGLIHSPASKSRPLGEREDMPLSINSERVERVEGLIKEENQKKTATELKDWRFTASHIIDLRKRLEQLDEFGQNLISRITQWQGWGDFEPQAIKGLAKQNIHLRLYQIPVKEIHNLPEDVFVQKVRVAGGIAHCIMISRGQAAIPYKEVTLPNISLSTMRLRLAENEQVTSAIKNELNQLAPLRDKLLAIKKSLENELEFQQALKGMGRQGPLVYLTGYIPFDATQPLIEAAQEEKYGLTITDPLAEDNVPTLIRNPAWVSLINPLFKVLELVPGYQELDISLWFLVFFSIFFGILIGDAGYGAVYLLLTLFAQKKLGPKLKNNSLFLLFYILSTFALVWGILSGTFFGQEWLPSWFRPLIPALRSDKNTQAFCFFLGALHLSIAHLWKGMLKAPSLTALADVGWATILWGAFFLAKTLVLGEPFPGFGKWFFIIGPSLVVLFTSPNKNIIKGISSGLGTLALSIVNSFTDVVSYIRLFAVGLATVAVADAFNKMALGVGFGNVVSGLFTSLILVLGHLLNIVLGPMAALVHGVRLNVLEFSSHVDIKWSGFSYKPLQEYQPKN